MLEARRADGGEEYGLAVAFKAKPGQWLCRNQDNGHIWVVSDEGFDELYCKIGESPKKREKKQEDGYRKGKSRHRSLSNDIKQDFGSLFEERDEEEEDEVDRDMV